MNDGSAIVANNLVKWFGEGEARSLAVKGASFEARWGEMLYLVGPSGSGKTTLLSMISGILRPSEGAVHVKEIEIWQLDNDQLAEFRLGTVGFVFQDYHLFPRLTTAENVAIPLILRGEKWDEALRQAQHYLEIVGLAAHANIPPVKLSGGEQQRVAIARAIISQPEILIFDEPTASLDGDTGRKILSFVREQFLNDARSILIVTHDARIFDYADRIMKMEDGKIIGFEKAGT